MGKQVELLAPAGGMEAFQGAINAGADAIYLAGNRYGARAYAENFSDEELLSCLKQAHLFGKKIYLTVNTLLREKELEELPDFIRPLAEEGLDGVILQDFGVCKVLHERFPELPLHASTQMSITGSHGARLLRQNGIVRVVSARELSLSEIQALKNESGLEIECFIHGAMCYSYSGQCLFSSILGGRSGNRGKCAQPCRLPYAIVKNGKAGKDCYPLSLKDACTAEIIPQLIQAGIDSFKIEGRMKKPEYIAGVTAFYRKCIDRYYEGKQPAFSLRELEDLSHLYLRSERGTGYYFRRNGKEMITLHNPAYQASDEEVLKKIRSTYLSGNKKIAISMHAELVCDQPARLLVRTAEGKPFQAEVLGDAVMKAVNAPVSRENVIKQLTKLGDSSFRLQTLDPAESITLTMDENIFYPLKQINELRRNAVKALEEVMLNDGER